MAWRHSDRPLAQGVRDPRGADAPCWGRALTLCHARTGMGLRLREPLEHRRGLHPLPAREDRSAVRPPYAADRQRSRIPRLRGLVAAPKRWLRRMPIRWRLTLMFAAVMAVLLAALIAFLYNHFRSDLDYNINQSLSARAQDIAGLVRQGHAAPPSGPLRHLPASPDNVVHLLDQSGRVLGSAGVWQPALLNPGELPTAQEGPELIQRGSSLRLYALPLANDHKVVVAGVSLAERDAALDKLDNALLIGVPPALLLATLAAYVLAAAALRPVERMRQRAATISTDEISTRLPLPESQDEIRRLGDTLNEMLDRLEEGLNTKRTVVAQAPHQLRMLLSCRKADCEVSLR